MEDTTTAAGICEVQRRDIGTEMTPLGSSTATRCNTPIKSSSPARHNTPADRSGALVPCNTCIDISELNDCHFAKLKLSAQYDPIVSNWSTREEEEEEVSRSLRHLEISSGRTSIGVSWASAWEEEERTKSCLRLITFKKIHRHRVSQMNILVFVLHMLKFLFYLLNLLFLPHQISERRSKNSSLVKPSEC